MDEPSAGLRSCRWLIAWTSLRFLAGVVTDRRVVARVRQGDAVDAGALGSVIDCGAAGEGGSPRPPGSWTRPRSRSGSRSRTFRISCSLATRRMYEGELR